MKPFPSIAIALLVGSLIGATAAWRFTAQDGAEDGQRQPLYWVAPMDPNYRRDQPGKSPMGMDLVPVYEEEKEAGTVSINPRVVNNLGVRTATVMRGHLDLTVNTVGYVQYNEDRLVHIHPRVEGWVENLYVKAAGDPVKQGEPLYALYSPTLVNAQEEYLLAHKRNNPTLVSAAVERLAALQIPDTEIQRLKQTAKVSQTITFRAPQSGVLDNLNVREGMYVKPGMEMMAIGQLEHIWVIGEVFERQAMRVHEGDAVRMYLDYLPGREWRGRVDYIYPSLNTRTRTARVRIHFDNPDGYLRPGMFAQMVITTRPEEDALLVPSEAVIRTGSQARVVLAQGEGAFKSVAVEVGRIGEGQTEILSGLKEGERIVTSAQFLIDSESSKTSDFKRMDSWEDKAAVVWITATIESVMKKHRMITASHAPVEAWNWPAMTMDFTVAEGVEMTLLEPGSEVKLEVTRSSDGEYSVTDIKSPSTASADNSATVEGVINHIDTSERVLNISRGSIEKWQRPPATMDFSVEPEIELQALSPGDHITFTFVIDNGEFIVTALTSREHNHD